MHIAGPPTPSRHGRAGSMDFGGAQVATPRGNSFAEAAGSPRRTPRHSRNSSVEALASAAAFVQPYKASILYGEPPLPTLVTYVIRPCSPEEAAYPWTNPCGSVLEWEKRRIKSMGAAQKLQHSRPGIACTEACPWRHAFLAGLPLSPVPDD